MDLGRLRPLVPCPYSQVRNGTKSKWPLEIGKFPEATIKISSSLTGTMSRVGRGQWCTYRALLATAHFAYTHPPTIGAKVGVG